MKKKIFAVSIVAICLSILAYGTVAYFTSDEVSHNIITTGDVDIELVEKQLVGKDLIDYPEGPLRVMPATEVSKIVYVVNLEQPAFVRISLEFIFKDSSGEVFDLTEEEFDSLISVNLNNEDWIEKDGYYYYKQALAKGSESLPIFDTVSFNGQNMTNEYQNSTLDIIVTTEAVQSANNGSDPLKASGWQKVFNN